MRSLVPLRSAHFDRSTGVEPSLCRKWRKSYDRAMRPRPERLSRLLEQYFGALLARVTAAAAREGEPIVDLGRGNPETGPPQHVVEHARHVGVELPARPGPVASASWLVRYPPAALAMRTDRFAEQGRGKSARMVALTRVPLCLM